MIRPRANGLKPDTQNMVQDTTDFPWPTATATTTPSNGKLIACGQKRFLSQKSNLSFPAFLVQFNNKMTNNETHSYYQWRSKRDFLLLKRNKCNRPQHDFPKSSLAKLSEEAMSKPWVVPLTRDLVSDKVVILKQLGPVDILSDDDKDLLSLGYYHPNMKKAIKRLEDFMNDCIDSDGWIEFTRREDSDGIINFSCCSQVRQYSDDITKSAKFGQYFTIENNVQKVVDEAVASYDNFREQNSDGIIVFVEPSCGDGRIIMQLSNSLQSISAIDFFIVACDLDKQVLQKCQENLSNLELFKEGKIVLLNCDYLQTSASYFMSHFNTGGKQQTMKMIVIGNPPYSSGVGDGQSIDRDLPKKFITHSVGIGAVFVSFLLPQRYSREIESIKNQIAQNTNESWTCKYQVLEDSRFSFGGKLFHQPSIIQSWYFNK